VTVPAGLARELARSRARGESLLLTLDFDGTLASLRRRRGGARLPRRRRARLAALGRTPGVKLLIVSGRALSDLRARCRGTGAALAGDHGLRLEGVGAAWRHPDLARRSREADRLAAEARAATRGIAGVSVELKEASVAVHYRAAPSLRREPAPLRRVLRRLLLPGWRVASGKCLWELRPERDWGKGEVILLALKRLGPGWRALFVGDDATDEEGFAVLGRGAWTAKVGEGRTAARWRLRGLGGVDELLSAVRRARR